MSTAVAPMDPIDFASTNTAVTRTWLTDTICGLVDAPDPKRIRVQDHIVDGTIVFTIYAPAADLGKLIGKHGKNARALRTLLQCRGCRDRVRYALDIDNHPEEDAGDAEI